MMVWPEDLVKSIADRRCVLFLGAGISANSTNKKGEKPPTWKSFLTKLMSKYKKELRVYEDELKELLDRNSLLIACEIIVDTIGQAKFNDFVEDEFRRPAFAPNEYHEQIFSLDSRIVISPNIDKLYAQYALKESCGTVVTKSYTDKDVAKYLRTDDYLLVSIHGTVDDTSHLIFTHQQYAEARCNNASFYQMLDALIMTHTFIFLGCGINDPDIELVLENANFRYPYCKPHYFVAAEKSIPDGVKKSIQNNRNIAVVEYNNDDGSHIELLKGLQELNIQVEDWRKEYAGR